VVRQRVASPAIALLVFWLFWVIASIGWLVLYVAGPPEMIGLLLALFGLLVVSVMGAYGAWQMSQLRSYGWALASVIMMLVPTALTLPLGGCGALFFIMGIFMLVVLLRPDVQQAFQTELVPPATGPSDFSQDVVMAEPVLDAGSAPEFDDFDSIISEALSEPSHDPHTRPG
jgi:hypothetical protein